MTNDEIWEQIKKAPSATWEQIQEKVEYDCCGDWGEDD